MYLPTDSENNSRSLGVHNDIFMALLCKLSSMAQICIQSAVLSNSEGSGNNLYQIQRMTCF